MTEKPSQLDLEPESIGAECPECHECLGTPSAAYKRGISRPEEAAPHEVPDLICPLCGHEWRTLSITAVAAAWYGFGAYCAISEAEAAR